MKQLEETGKQGSPLNGTEEGERLDPWLSDTGRGEVGKVPQTQWLQRGQAPTSACSLLPPLCATTPGNAKHRKKVKLSQKR